MSWTNGIGPCTRASTCSPRWSVDRPGSCSTGSPALVRMLRRLRTDGDDYRDLPGWFAGDEATPSRQANMGGRHPRRPDSIYTHRSNSKRPPCKSRHAPGKGMQRSAGKMKASTPIADCAISAKSAPALIFELRTLLMSLFLLFSQVAQLRWHQQSIFMEPSGVFSAYISHRERVCRTLCR